MSRFNFYIEMQEDGRYEVSRGSSGWERKSDTFASADVGAVFEYINSNIHRPGHSMASSRFDLVVDEASREKMGADKVKELTDMLDKRTQQIAGVDAAVEMFADGFIGIGEVLDTADRNKY